MAREWLLRGVDPEELKNNNQPEVPQTSRSKWENFWYHHKWTFWGGVFLAVALAVLVTQLFTRDRPDYRVLLMTERTYLDPSLEAMEEELAQYGQDLDGDGKVEVSIQSCMLGEQVKQQYNSSIQMFQAHLMAGDVLLFVWDKDIYDQQMTQIDDLIEGEGDFLTTLPASDGVIEDGKVYNWKDSTIRQELEKRIKETPQAELEILFPDYDPNKPCYPEDLYFTVRYLSGTAEEANDLHQQSMTLLENLMKGQKTAQ